MYCDAIKARRKSVQLTIPLFWMAGVLYRGEGHTETTSSIGGSRGRHRRAPPTGSNSFVSTCFCQKAYVLEVGTSPTGRRPPNGKSWICYCLVLALITNFIQWQAHYIISPFQKKEHIITVLTCNTLKLENATCTLNLKHWFWHNMQVLEMMLAVQRQRHLNQL